MKKPRFPLYMDISEKKILVVGGGTIATRRVHTLLEFSSGIVVVAPTISAELEQLAQDGMISWVQEEYSARYVYEKDMVIAATNDSEVNHQVYIDCKTVEMERQKPILINVADDRTLCDFYFPSIVKKDTVVVGISSVGNSPKETKEIRKQIESLLKSTSIYKMTDTL